MPLRKLQLVPILLSFAGPWAVASCSSSENPTGTGGTGATGGTGPTGGMPGSGGAPGGNGGKASGGAPTGGVGGTASGSSGAGGAKAGGGGLGGTTGDAGMGGEAGMNETGGTAGSGTAGSGTAGSGTAGSGTAGSGTAGSGTAGSGAGGAPSGVFTVTSPGFMNMAGCSETMQSACDTYPVETSNFGDGLNISPELNWTGVPTDTGSFAVVLTDLSNGFAHWALWNIPGSATMLAADVPKTSNMPATPAGSQQANLGAGDGYVGPGSACNVYEFVVYALQAATFTPASTMDAAAVRTALDALSESAVRGKASIRARQAACSGGQMCAPTMNTCM
jgi:phosphatidylethanolamine-binding protein (PEBP) family uncharacterized protein